MAQRSSFNVSKLSSADKILLGAAVLLLIDSFIPWQRACFSVGNIQVGCPSASMWSGNGSFLGVLTGIFLIVLIVWLGANAAGVSMQVGMPASSVTSILVAGTVLFGIIKFFLSAFNHGWLGAWIGLILLLGIAYGGYMKMQEPSATAAPPATGGGFTS